MKRAISDHFVFLTQMRKQSMTTGSVAPSGRFLASALTAPLKASREPVRILEVGPGTGAVTRKIVSLLKPGDRLDLVELNETFADFLKKRFEDVPEYRRVADQSEVHVCPLQEFQTDTQYDFIISGLPLNNFSPDLVEEIFELYLKLLAPNGVLSYFEYMYVRKIRVMMARKKEENRITVLDNILNSYLSKHRFRRKSVFANFPPAWVQHLRSES